MAHARESQTLGAPLVIHLLFKKINQIFFLLFLKNKKLNVCVLLLLFNYFNQF